ncbi:MAG TPA: hypothetical protein VEJ16_10465 [Alphaproteobacteria bacterium]|nr:hypothetical protein [Alphaproteobacteria bacterium]
MRKFMVAAFFIGLPLIAAHADESQPAPTASDIQQAVRAHIAAEVGAIEAVQRKDVPPIRELLGPIADRMLPDPASIQVTVDREESVAAGHYTALVTISGNLGTEQRSIELVRKPDRWALADD